MPPFQDAKMASVLPVLRMKIAVVGCGAVGSFYGAKLARAGQDVHFLLRSDFEQVRQHGLRVLSPDGDFQLQPLCAQQPEEIGPSDCVLIGLKTTANEQLKRLLSTLLTPATMVVTLQNGLGNEETLAQFVPPSQILGGLCFVCLHRIEPGLIRHFDHGKIVLGEHTRPSQPRTHALAALFRQAGVPCEVTENLTKAHWEKLTWNIPFNGLGVASSAGYESVVSGRWDGRQPAGPCLTTDLLLKDTRWEDLVRELMNEVIGGARARGLDVWLGLGDKQIERTRTMGAYKPSTVLDYERGLPLELHSVFLEPLRQVREAGTPAPRLEALCGVLRALTAS
jgi:2-dehydropantoate 2-reductase